MSNYWTRLRDVVTFLFIWLCLPLYFIYKGGYEPAVVATLIFMWIPALIIAAYLTEEDAK